MQWKSFHFDNLCTTAISRAQPNLDTGHQFLRAVASKTVCVPLCALALVMTASLTSIKAVPMA
eukprot:2931199-Pleurochrysis_carterae.AAC.8